MSTEQQTPDAVGSPVQRELGLAERLRRLAPHMSHQQDRDVFIEAADEIERLQWDFGELRGRIAQIERDEGKAVAAERERMRELIADDASAMTYQTMGQYRSALLKALKA